MDQGHSRGSGEKGFHSGYLLKAEPTGFADANVARPTRKLELPFPEMGKTLWEEVKGSVLAVLARDAIGHPCDVREAGTEN